MRCALDISKVPDLVRAALLEAVREFGNAEVRDGFTFWIAEGAHRGTRWTSTDGPLRRIGIPTEVLERCEIPDVSKEAGIPAPPALPPAESLLDPLVDYPIFTTQNGPLEEVIAWRNFSARNFPRRPHAVFCRTRFLPTASLRSTSAATSPLCPASPRSSSSSPPPIWGVWRLQHC